MLFETKTSSRLYYSFLNLYSKQCLSVLNLKQYMILLILSKNTLRAIQSKGNYSFSTVLQSYLFLLYIYFRSISRLLHRYNSTSSSIGFCAQKHIQISLSFLSKYLHSSKLNFNALLYLISQYQYSNIDFSNY